MGFFFGTLSTTTDPYDTDKMAIEFLQQYIDHAFSIGQCVWNINISKKLNFDFSFSYHFNLWIKKL
jgi:hypothetical protein